MSAAASSPMTTTASAAVIPRAAATSDDSATLYSVPVDLAPARDGASAVEPVSSQVSHQLSAEMQHLCMRMHDIMHLPVAVRKMQACSGTWNASGSN